jgi:hypothetical protein
MTNVVKFTGTKVQPGKPTGPYWAGRPMQEAFPEKKVRATEEVRARSMIMRPGKQFFEGPEGEA